MKVCIIPARGGSKRIPRKNIKPFAGKPMIAHSITVALESGCFDKVIVSTDDDEIAEVAKQHGAEVPFIRPKELANDFAGTLPVIKHAVEWFEPQEEPLHAVCCLYATAPFVTPSSLVQAYAQFIETQADYCFTVTEFASAIQRAFKITEKERLQMFNPENFSVRSQDLEKAFYDAGQFYWGKPEAFKQLTPIFSEAASPFVLPHYLVQDIDTPEDLEWLKMLK